MTQKKKIGRVKLVFLLGGLIGAVLGLLFAPKRGVETRRELLVRGAQARSTAETVAARTAAQVREKVVAGAAASRVRLSPIVSKVRARVGRDSTESSAISQEEDDQSGADRA